MPRIHNQSLWIQLLMLLVAMQLPGSVARGQAERLEFTRMIAHWAKYADPEYLAFVKEAKPEIVQLGFYGAHYWSLAHTPQYGGYPAHFPHQGLAPTGDWFAEHNEAIHRMGGKVVGHFNVEFLVGDPGGKDGPRGFFHFYHHLWDESELGPKPVADPLALLEKDADGNPISNSNYSIGQMREYWACLRNPHWQQVLKAWVRRGIQRGIDGYIANYFYRHNCLCEHCQRGFRHYMAQRFTPEQLDQRFGIENLQSHQFSELIAWHDPQKSTPLKREMLRWSQISNKEVFDEVFHHYGRSLKPDLITAQWNHLGNFSQIRGDERCMLPSTLWGDGESYLWYSTGGSANHTDLPEGHLGEGTLHARYIRGTFDDKPFTLGKYENTRIRVAIAELAANGGAPMGFYTRFTDPDARRVITQYYQFLAQHNDVYYANRSWAEAAVLFPRSEVHKGDVEPVEIFKSTGKAMLDQHVLFDVIPDDQFDSAKAAQYRWVAPGDKPEGLAVSRFELESTVRVSASRPHQGTSVHLHFVNYNRIEPPKDRRGRPSPGRGINDEKPIASEGGRCEFVLPDGLRPHSVSFFSPESPQKQPLEFSISEERVTFQLPSFLVYSVVEIK